MPTVLLILMALAAKVYLIVLVVRWARMSRERMKRLDYGRIDLSQRENR